MYHGDAEGNCKARSVYENSKVALPPLETETYNFVRSVKKLSRCVKTYRATSR